MKILIIEDEKLAADRLEILLSKITLPTEVIGKTSSIVETINFLHDNPPPDLIFLDIHLSDGDSFHLLESIDIDIPIIFCTAYDQYALEAFEHLCIDYLVKPVSQDMLKEALMKTSKYKRLFSNQVHKTATHKEYKKRFLIKQGTKYILKPCREAAFFYAEGKSVFLVGTDSRKYVLDHSLDKLEELLDPKQFFRINRNIIVSLDAIKEFKSYNGGRLKAVLKTELKMLEAVVSRNRVPHLKVWAEA